MISISYLFHINFTDFHNILTAMALGVLSQQAGICASRTTHTCCSLRNSFVTCLAFTIHTGLSNTQSQHSDPAYSGRNFLHHHLICKIRILPVHTLNWHNCLKWRPLLASFASRKIQLSLQQLGSVTLHNSLYLMRTLPLPIFSERILSF